MNKIIVLINSIHNEKVQYKKNIILKMLEVAPNNWEPTG